MFAVVFHEVDVFVHFDGLAAGIVVNTYSPVALFPATEMLPSALPTLKMSTRKLAS